MEEKSIHLKGLNGIRALAALSVVVSHTILEIEYFGITRVAQGWNFASYGVTMFFTLSGFLITYLLLKEKAAFDTIEIKKFYVRRILRIWPLYYFYIVVFLLITFNDNLPGTFSYYLFMGANIPAVLGISIPLLAHYWSLGVEEQFYIFWPWLVKWFSPLRSIGFFLAFFLTLKLLLRIFVPETFAYQFICVTRFDCMAIGALWAILLSGYKKNFTTISFHPITQLLSWIVLLLTAIGKFNIPDFINQDIFSVACAFIIVNVAFNAKTLISLENGLFNFLGKISYGIYVYHVLVIYTLGLLLKGSMPDFDNVTLTVLITIFVVVLTIFVSWISYNFMETKFLKLKGQFSRIFSHS